MWGVLHFLDYHRWYSIKKILPHRKHNRGRRARCWGNPRTVSFGHDPSSEAQGLLDTEANSHPVIQQDGKTSPSYAKANSRTLIQNEISEEVNDVYCSCDSSAELKVLQSSLNHYVEHSDSSLTRKRSNRTKSVKFLDGADSLSVGLQNSFPLKRDNVDAQQTNTQVMQPVDTLEVFKVKNELFHKVFQGLDYQERQSLSPKPRLVKSGSYPMPSSGHSRSSKPSTLKHKQSEVWSFRKGRKSLSSIQDSKFAGLTSPTNLIEKSAPLKDADVKELELRSSSKGFVHQGWNQLVTTRFKHIKKRIKNVLMESKKEKNHTINDALLSRNASSSSTEDTTACQDTKDNFESLHESNNYDYNSMKSTPTSLKKISSLNESLDKYARLLEQGSKKTDTLHQSRSLKLTSEDGVLSNKQSRKSYRRNLSVPDIDLICFSLFEVPHDVLTPSSAPKTSVDHPMDNGHGTQAAATPVVEDVNAQNNESIAALDCPDFEEKLKCPASDEVGDNCEGMSNAIELNKDILEVQLEDRKQESIVYNERVTEVPLNSSCDHAQTSFPSETIRRGDFPVSEALNARNQSDQPVPLIPRIEDATKDVGTNFGSDQEDTDFRYVKNLLALSGIPAKECQDSWDDQPLNNSLFKELEIQVYKNPECCTEDVDVDYRHLIMFELVNEVLTDIYDRTFTYFPRPFSCVGSWRMEHHLLDEVWKRVSWYLSLRPELDMMLDDVVGRDLSRDDGWMNIKFENDCLALQLEDLIFDELLEEVICSGKC